MARIREATEVEKRAMDLLKRLKNWTHGRPLATPPSVKTAMDKLDFELRLLQTGLSYTPR